MAITETKINSVQRKIKQAIAKIEQEENVKISFGTCRYTDLDYKSTMTVKTTAKTKKVKEVENSKNTELSKLFGFSKNIVGETFQFRGNEATVKGFNTRARKYPIMFSMKGGNYKMSPSELKSVSKLK